MRAGASAILLACMAAALMLGAVARSAAGPAPSFAAAKTYATGARPFVLTLGDLNDDQREEISRFARRGSLNSIGWNIFFILTLRSGDPRI